MSYSSNANIKKKRSEDDDRKTAELILAHLRTYHFVKEKAIHRLALYEEVKWKIGHKGERTMRRIMSEYLRGRGFCSGTTGYWYSEDVAEKRKAAAFLRSYGKNSYAGSDRILGSLEDGNQMRLC